MVRPVDTRRHHAAKACIVVFVYMRLEQVNQVLSDEYSRLIFVEDLKGWKLEF
jgi:hypothetical protein